MSSRLEKYLSDVITYLAAIATSLAFLVLPSALLYIIFTKIIERGRESVIAAAILFVLTAIYNTVIFLFTRKVITVGESRLEKMMWVCLRIGGAVFVLAMVLTAFVLLAGLLESAAKL